MVRVSNEEVLSDLNKGTVNNVMCSKARLEGFIELMVGHVLLKLSSDSSV